MGTPSRIDMLDEPIHSRQWVLRRLQRALTSELAAAAFQAGVARGSGSEVIAADAAAAEARAASLEALIVAHDSAPYGSFGLARGVARFGGWLLGILGAWAWRRALHPLATHMLSEYDLLVAFVEGAPGANAGLGDTVRPLLESARRWHESLAEGRV